MNSLTLAIVNDGDTYRERLSIAREPQARRRLASWSRMVAGAEMREQWKFGADPRPFAELLQSVADLERYYADHVAEIDRCAAEDAAAAATRSGVGQ